MTTTLPASDPRIAPLLHLTQGLLAKYTGLAGLFAGHIPDEQVRQDLLGHVQNVVDEARQAYAEIAIIPTVE